ncbi:MAG TPA: serine/threonine-protein kinase [Bryobacteraceae bacterium]|nr:serine/threonine-protein kinase [Bryobacteraceae bacterium]
MQAEIWKRVEELFLAVKDQPPTKRPEYLKQACPDDAQIRAEVQSLLDAESSPNSFLNSAPISMLLHPPVLAPGQDLGGFEILELIGKGGMGEVYRARDARLNREVAIKVLVHALWEGDERTRKRLMEEARAASALSHPNVVTVHAIQQAGGLSFLVMEYIDGETLSTRLRRGPMEFRQVVELGIQVADALAAAHARGMVHRDIKPGNIMITCRGAAKVLDFGLSKRTPGLSLATLDTTLTASLSSSGVIAGTLLFMSPEQACGEPLDGRSDIFSLGVVLYQAATGKLPYQGANTLSVLHESRA